MDEKDQNSVYFIKTDMSECDSFSKIMLRNDLILKTSNDNVRLPSMMNISPQEEDEKVNFSLNKSSDSLNFKEPEETFPKLIKTATTNNKENVNNIIEPPEEK